MPAKLVINVAEILEMIFRQQNISSATQMWHFNERHLNICVHESDTELAGKLTQVLRFCSQDDQGPPMLREGWPPGQPPPMYGPPMPMDGAQRQWSQRMPFDHRGPPPGTYPPYPPHMGHPPPKGRPPPPQVSTRHENLPVFAGIPV